jgi:hypothetical protein
MCGQPTSYYHDIIIRQCSINGPAVRQNQFDVLTKQFVSFSAHHPTKRAACRYERLASRSRLHGPKWTVPRGRYVGLNGERGAATDCRRVILLQSPPTTVLSKSQAHSKSSDLSRHGGQNDGRPSPSSSFR